MCKRKKKNDSYKKYDMDSIIEKSYDIDTNDSDEIIKFYTENRLYFDNFEIITDIETIEEIVYIKQKYTEAIERKAHYCDAIIILKHIFILLEKLKDKSLKYESDYERALFYEGVVLGRQEKYSESNERFKKLIVIDPQNERYKNWYLTNKEWIFKKKFGFLEYVLLFVMAITLLFGKKIFGKNLFYVDLPVFIIFLCWLFYTFIYRKIVEYRVKSNKKDNDKSNA